MKPGAITSPDASTVRAARIVSAGPGSTIRSPSTATLAAYPAAPVPSTTVPPSNSRSTSRVIGANGGRAGADGAIA